MTDLNLDALALGPRHDKRSDFFNDLYRVGLDALDSHLPRFNLGDVQHIVDHREQVAGV